VQTFLPYPSFEASARALDHRRLGKQRVEALQILNALTVAGNGWRNHPAVLMWRGYEEALVRYCLDICAVWCELGFNDTCATKVTDALRERLGIHRVRTQAELESDGDVPPWLGDQDLHRSHRSALLRKDAAHYRPLFGEEPDDLEYVWPVRARSS
jgi:hypothetical protein